MRFAPILLLCASCGFEVPSASTHSYTAALDACVSTQLRYVCERLRP